MKEELQTALADLISKTLQGVDASKDFLTAEIPDVVEQLLMWHGVYSFVMFLMGVFILGLMVWLNWKQYKWLKVDGNLEELDAGIMANMLQVFPVVGICVLLNLTWLQIWIAPKVWLIEYMGNLVK